MADESNDLNRPTRHGAQKDTTNQNQRWPDSAFTGSWGSPTSSLFNSSFPSELVSSETDNDDGNDEFIAELTRQMADYMLQEDGDDNNTYPEGFVSQKSISQVKNHNHNQNQNRNEQRVGRRKSGKMIESTQRMKSSNGRVRPVTYGPLRAVGSDMRVIFLNGSGSSTGSNGTGVFLPRSATDAPAMSRKKPGYSTALVPSRVLQALEQHFNNINSYLTQGQKQHKLDVRSEHLERKLPG